MPGKFLTIQNLWSTILKYKILYQTTKVMNAYVFIKFINKNKKKC